MKNDIFYRQPHSLFSKKYLIALYAFLSHIYIAFTFTTVVILIKNTIHYKKIINKTHKFQISLVHYPLICSFAFRHTFQESFSFL